METWQVIAISAAVLLILAVVGLWLYKRSRSRRLQQRFGPEYDRTLKEIGDRGEAESELTAREKRVRRLRVRPLDADERKHFAAEWRRCQAEFVDDPGLALTHADILIDQVMRTRGYPVHTVEDRISNLAAAHPYRVMDYETATRIRKEDESTEGLRSAFVHYKVLFEELIGGDHEELKRAS